MEWQTQVLFSEFGIGSILLAPLTEGGAPAFSWLFGLLGIIFGHIGAARGKQIGIGRAQGIIGLTLGYITLVYILCQSSSCSSCSKAVGELLRID